MNTIGAGSRSNICSIVDEQTRHTSRRQRCRFNTQFIEYPIGQSFFADLQKRNSSFYGRIDQSNEVSIFATRSRCGGGRPAARYEVDEWLLRFVLHLFELRKWSHWLATHAHSD